MIPLRRALGAVAAGGLALLALFLAESAWRAPAFFALGSAVFLIGTGKRTLALLSLLGGAAALVALSVDSLGLRAAAIAIAAFVALDGALAPSTHARDARGAWARTAALSAALALLGAFLAYWRPTREIARGTDAASLTILIGAIGMGLALTLSASEDATRET